MDPSSYANCDQVNTTNYQLDVFVDFDVLSLGGFNTLQMVSLTDNLSQVVLDYQGMTILGVE